MTLILTSFLICSFGHAFEAEQHQLVGRFLSLKKSDSRNVIGTEFYFTLVTNKGVKMAYPVEVADKKLRKSIIQNLDKQYYISATSYKKKITEGELSREIPALKVEKAQQLDLGKLAFKDFTHNKEGEYDPQGLPLIGGARLTKKGVVVTDRLNDTVTNSIIFTAGALLLGDILFSK